VFGQCQYFEKMIPKCIHNLEKNKKIPIYGQGTAMRKYLYVGDACEAYLTIMEKGEIGKIYEMGTSDEYTAYDIAKMLISILKPGDDIDKWIEHVVDRPFHDTRYIVNQATLTELGWSAKTPFDVGMSRTVEWYTKYAIPSAHWPYNNETIMITKM
jgi:dTDP-glucose 4,6-dehydratase